MLTLNVLFLAFMGLARAQPARSQKGHYGLMNSTIGIRHSGTGKGARVVRGPTVDQCKVAFEMAVWKSWLTVSGRACRHMRYFRKPAQTYRHMSAVPARTVSIHSDLSSALFSDQASDWLKDEPVSDVGRQIMLRLVQLDGPVAFDSHAKARADIGIVVPDREVLYAAVVPERH